MKVVILGAGIAGRLYLDTLKYSAEADNTEVIGFIDDNPALQGHEVSGIPVLGTFTQLPDLIKTHGIEGVMVAYSDRFARLRGERFSLCRELGLKTVNVIHPSATIASSVNLGEGVYIGINVIIELGTKIGDNCSIHRGSIVGEDCVLEEGVFLTAGVNLAASVTIGQNAMLGTGAIVIPKCHIAENAVVGAGAVVIDDVPPGATVVGIPARVIK